MNDILRALLFGLTVVGGLATFVGIVFGMLHFFGPHFYVVFWTIFIFLYASAAYYFLNREI